MSEKGKIFYNEHKDAIRERQKKYRKENKDYVNKVARASSQKWRDANIEKYRAYGLAWSKRNPEKAALFASRRRAQKKNCVGIITEKEWKDLLEKYNHMCLRCGRNDVPLTLDHIIPIANQGSNTIDNAQPLCRSCNSHKRIKTIDYRP